MPGKGNLVIIGGAEDKEEKCEILEEVVGLAGGERGKIIVITTATQKPEEIGSIYINTFRRLGVKEIQTINIDDRQDAYQDRYLRLLDDATCIFFTGGDQLRITSILGGTPLGNKLRELFNRGVPVAGTSAGASAMSNTMIVTGNEEDSPRKCTVKMAPGLGLLEEAVVDQHFAQRGRIGRLLCAVAQNPRVLGIGIDEDTAIVVEGHRFRVIGSRAVTVVDGSTLLFSNVSESKPDDPLALVDIRLHVLPKGYGFDFKAKKPLWEDRA